MSEVQKKIATTDLWFVAALLCHAKLPYDMIVEDKARKRVAFQIEPTEEIAKLEKAFYAKSLLCEPTDLKNNVTMIKARIEQLVK
jgi:hypothetical protein